MTGPELTAEQIINHLGLEPLAGEGGLFRETYQLPASDLADGPAATAIYYFLTPDTFSELHRLPADEVYHFYLGDPVDLLLLAPDGEVERRTLGQDLLDGMAVQSVVPAGVWQGSRLRAGGQWALMGTTMTPGFRYDCYEQGTQVALLEIYPDAADEIRELTRQ